MNLINWVSGETTEVIDTSKQMDELITEQANVIGKTIESFDDILKSVQDITPMGIKLISLSKMQLNLKI